MRYNNKQINHQSDSPMVDYEDGAIRTVFVHLRYSFASYFKFIFILILLVTVKLNDICANSAF